MGSHFDHDPATDPTNETMNALVLVALALGASGQQFQREFDNFVQNPRFNFVQNQRNNFADDDVVVLNNDALSTSFGNTQQQQQQQQRQGVNQFTSDNFQVLAPAPLTNEFSTQFSNSQQQQSSFGASRTNAQQQLLQDRREQLRLQRSAGWRVRGELRRVRAAEPSLRRQRPPGQHLLPVLLRRPALRLLRRRRQLLQGLPRVQPAHQRQRGRRDLPVQLHVRRGHLVRPAPADVRPPRGGHALPGDQELPLRQRAVRQAHREGLLNECVNRTLG